MKKDSKLVRMAAENLTLILAALLMMDPFHLALAHHALLPLEEISWSSEAASSMN